MALAPEPHWHILGAGAIGSLFAHELDRAGSAVTLLLRNGGAPQRIVFEKDAIATALTIPQLPCSAAQGISHLLVTTKAYDVRAAVHSVSDKLLPGAPVVLLVNGMGLREALTVDFPHMSIYCGTTTQGAHRVATNDPAEKFLRHAGTGATRLGGGDTVPTWFHLWRQGIEDCAWDREIEQALWHKLAINCVINPLTAVHRCHNGDLATRAELTEKVEQLCTEIKAISAAAGFGHTALAIERDAAQVIQLTAANRSSMLQDIDAGRPTEIDYISGYLLSVAAQHGVKAPHNTALYHQVQAIGR